MIHICHAIERRPCVGCRDLTTRHEVYSRGRGGSIRIDVALCEDCACGAKELSMDAVLAVAGEMMRHHMVHGMDRDVIRAQGARIKDLEEDKRA